MAIHSPLLFFAMKSLISSSNYIHVGPKKLLGRVFIAGEWSMSSSSSIWIVLQRKGGSAGKVNY
jgi:hypothetical protein